MYLKQFGINDASFCYLPEITVSHADWWANPIEFPAKQVYSPASSMVILDK